MSDEDLDLSSFSQKFADVRRERDVLKSQLSDLEKSFAASESKVAYLEQELQKMRSQTDSLKSKIVEKETVIQGIASVILTHVGKGPEPRISDLSGVSALPGVSLRSASQGSQGVSLRSSKNEFKEIRQAFSDLDPEKKEEKGDDK